jgi:hypothetical protein
MHRILSFFALSGAALFFACNDTGTSSDLNVPSAVGVCGKLKECCESIKTESTKTQCLEQAATLEKNATSNPDATRQACDNAAQGYTAAKVCGPDAIDPGKGGAGGAGAGGASSGAGGTGGTEGGAAGQPGGAGGATGQAETTDDLCSDGKDNDGNGFADCEDFNCATAAGITVCNPQGGAGGSGGSGGDPFGGSGGSTGSGENSVQACTDGADNDGDKFVDCDDFDCCALVDCKAIDPSSSCAKKGSGGSGGSTGKENTAALCQDNKDNDGDKFVDCDDFDCCDLVDCKAIDPSSSCAKKGSGGSGGSTGKENTVALCGDGKDNDGDKFIDCDDFDCCPIVDCKAIAPTSACAKK